MLLTKIPPFVEGEKCWCGKKAFQKIEVIHDNNFVGHAMNTYICEEHFYLAMRGCSKEEYIKKIEDNGGTVFKDTDFDKNLLKIN